MEQSKDELGDRMKVYEQAEAGRRLLPLLPIMARIDGRGFSRFTKGMDRPFDARMSRLMIETTKFLVLETGALCGYTQSDEISLCWIQPHYESEVFFGGNIQKLVSQLAAMATVKFNHRLGDGDTLPGTYRDNLPTFDARVWNVPNRTEAMNCLLWREIDATKNAVSMAARCHYSHKETHGMGTSDLKEMLLLKGVDGNTYPSFFTRGTYVRRVKTTRKFTAEELERLPEKHAARLDPAIVVERTDLTAAEIPPLKNLVNREDVLFSGAEPEVRP